MRRPEGWRVLAVAVLGGLLLGAAAKNDRPVPFDFGGGGKRREPITVTADTLEYDYKVNVVTYRGNVLAVQGDVKVKSDVLTIALAEREQGRAATPNAGRAGAAPAAGGNLPGEGGAVKVQTITATGKVRIDQGTRFATGGKAVFDQHTRTVVLSDDPLLHDGPNEIAGDRVVVFLDENRSVVEGGRKRVKAVLHPEKGGGLAPEAPVAALAPATPGGGEFAP